MSCLINVGTWEAGLQMAMCVLYVCGAAKLDETCVYGSPKILRLCTRGYVMLMCVEPRNLQPSLRGDLHA